VRPVISANDYFATNPSHAHTLEKLKSNRVFCYDVNDNETNFSVYSCLYYERKYKGKTYILFSNSWFCVNEDFLDSINISLKNVPISKIQFPDVLNYVNTPPGKGKKPTVSVENEGAYNSRVSRASGYHLLDKKLVKPRTGASSIELCDLLTDAGEFVHAKHRKGGSAGISHLFAQGKISAELLLSDQEFRKGARAKLSGKAKGLVPLAKFEPSASEIVFLVLGDNSNDVKKNLPFFSKVNLWLTYQSLTQKNFKVSIAGAALAAQQVTAASAPIVPRIGSINVSPSKRAKSSQPTSPSIAVPVVNRRKAKRP